MKRYVVLLAVVASLVWAPGLAAAKGNIQTRAYAVITGPGLSRPIVYSAPWDSAKGGYYSDDAEIFLALANYSGATPAGKDLVAGGGSVPDAQRVAASADPASSRMSLTTAEVSNATSTCLRAWRAGPL